MNTMIRAHSMDLNSSLKLFDFTYYRIRRFEAKIGGQRSCPSSDGSLITFWRIFSAIRLRSGVFYLAKISFVVLLRCRKFICRPMVGSWCLLFQAKNVRFFSSKSSGFYDSVRWKFFNINILLKINSTIQFELKCFSLRIFR